MARLPIRLYPDPILRKIAEPVARFDDDLKKLVRDMTETMFDEPGLGLAATQIGVSLHLFIVDETVFVGRRDAGAADPRRVRVFINSIVTMTEGEQTDIEGCLSFPGVFEEILRPQKVGVRAYDLDGKPFNVVVENLAARALSHEIDHLEARLMIDYVSPLKRRFIKREAERGFPNAARNREARNESIPG